MVNANVKLILLIVILTGILFSGCTSKSETNIQTTAPVQTISPRPTQTPISNDAIYIKHSATTADSIGEFNKAPAGKTYLIISLDIKNKGYKEFNTNSLYWEIDTNKRSYPISFASFSLENKLDLVTLYDGGEISGSIAFEVPADTKEYALRYNRPGANYNIIYST